MIISLNWLNDYVSLEGLSSKDIAKHLTSLGLEVEHSQESASLDELIVVGRIRAAQKHPNADSLRLCVVDVGAGADLNIVCGAANAREGIYVAVAQKGSVLPDGLKIKASKIRGEASEGMLCSQRELGISDEHSGIMEWSEAPGTLGSPVRAFLQKSDAIFELNVTPNRSDCFSYIGVARDLSAKLKRPLKKPVSDLSIPKAASQPLHVEIENPELSGRFCALAMTGAKALASPAWLQKRLTENSIRTVNLIVDATNYVMFEYGQPIHAYDRRFVSGDTLKVSSGSKERYQTLDEAEIQLEAGDILIRDTSKIVGLAGIMGGKNSEIKDDTSEIILEVAHFPMEKIRKTARRLALHSEASFRFERGVDIQAIPEVLKRVASLIQECMKEQGVEPAKVTSALVDLYPNPQPVHKIALRLSRARMMIANPVLKQEQCVSWLQSLGFKLSDQKEDRMLFEVPSWRNEVMTYPFTGSEDSEKLKLFENHGLWPTVQLANALNERQSFMQTVLLPGLLHALSRNRNRGLKGVRLFEVGRCLFSSDSLLWKEGGEDWKRMLRPSRLLSKRARAEVGRVIERESLGAVIDQPYSAKEWDREEVASNFFHGKELVTKLLSRFGINRVDFVPIEEAWLPFLHPNASAWVQLGRDRLGWVGDLHPQVAKAFDLEDKAPVCMQLDLETVFEVYERQTYKIKSVGRFPPVVRDLALLVSKDLTYKDFLASVAKFPGKKHLNDVQLFDLYEGSQLGEGKKSFAVSCTFQSAERTLKDEEVEAELASLLSHLTSKLGAVQR